MTRSYSFRTVTRRVPRMERPPRRPCTFTCFRLVEIDDPAPGEAAFEAIELVFPPNMMAALVTR
jgi:hypothetical protein